MTLESLAQPWRPGSRLSAREVGIAAAALLALVAVVWGPSVGMGGWWVDDWALIHNFRFAPGDPSTPWDLIAANDVYRGYRPGNRVLTALIQWVAGEAHAPRLAIGFALGALQALALYVVLRLAGLTAAAAAGPAALMAVLPSLDTTRVLWSAFHHTAGACLYLAGLAVALAGLRSGRRPVAWHAAALGLYAAALLTYEAFAALVAGGGLLYLLVSRRPRAALPRWGADLALLAAGVPLALSQAGQIRDTDLSPAGLAGRAGDTFGAGTRVLEFTLPADQFLTTVPGAVVAALLALGVLLALRRRSPLARAARAWLGIGLVGALFTYTGLLALLGGAVTIEPAWQGVGNRVTMGMSPGQVVVVASLLWLAAIGAAELVRRPPLAAPLAGAMVVVAVAALAAQVRGNLDDWRLAREWQRRSVDLVARAWGPRPPAGAVAIVFGQPYWSPRGAPVFLNVDLTLAGELHYDRRRLTARPYFPGDSCTAAGYGIAGWPEAGAPARAIALSYARLWMVDWRDGRARRVRDRASCVAETARLLPGQPSLVYPGVL